MTLKSYFKREKVTVFLIIGGVIVIAAGLVMFFWRVSIFKFSNKIDAERVGQFGDFVGGVAGSLWALAGVLLFYSALKEQREDFRTNREAVKLQLKALEKQIEEFEEQRKELASSRKIYEQQSKTQRLQQFESNFYSLLNVYLGLKNNLNQLDSGKDYFEQLFNDLAVEFNPPTSLNEYHDETINKYVEVFNKNRGHLSHYFKSLYRIIKVIDTSENLNNEEKLFYAKILRSQLTDYELIIIFYNSYSVYGQKAIPLLLKYNFLKHIPIFKTPCFDYFFKKQSDYNIVLFAERFTSFLINNVPKFYDLDGEETPHQVEETFNGISATVGIYFSENIDIKVICDKDIKLNGINMKEEDFKLFLFNLLYNNFILMTHIQANQITLKQYSTDSGQNITFGITAITQKQIYDTSSQR